jgi:hypothetical protein
MGRDLLCKPRSQITFDYDSMAALKLGGPEAKILTLMVAQEEEWQLYASKKEIPEMPELSFKIPGIWTENNPPGLIQNIPLMGVELKPRAIPVSHKQYYIPHKVQIEIQKHIDRLPLCSQLNNCYFTPCGTKSIHTLGPDPR